MTETLIKAIAVTAELTDTQLSEAASRVMASDLSRYPEQQVLGALTRCRRELRGKLTLADVISRLDDGRPGPEEAWAMLPRDESQTVVWTAEMAKAWGVALPLLIDGDNVQARMAFIEVYRREVQAARDAGIPVCWTPSLGTDKHGREAVLLEAARLGRLDAGHVTGLLSLPVPDGAIAQIQSELVAQLKMQEPAE